LKTLLVHASGYDFSLPGLDRLHPFDGRKFSRALSIIRQRLGPQMAQHSEELREPASDVDLLRVHTPEYLASLASPSVVAAALELWPLKLLPRRTIERRLLLPMRLAVAGTILATRRALEGRGAMVMNVGGGFHHAFRDHGEGFCLYADIPIAIAAARAGGSLDPHDPIAIIDLDAHRGNGVWEICGDDPAVRVMDVYNFQTYPGLFPGAVEDFPFEIPLKAGTADQAYLETVREELPRFLASMPAPRLVFYNAGTDIVAGDAVGRLGVSPAGVVTRDRFVVETLAERRIPTVIVTGGGYTRCSYELVAQLALTLVERLRTSSV
jgi:histone deacetylase 11